MERARRAAQNGVLADAAHVPISHDDAVTMPPGPGAVARTWRWVARGCAWTGIAPPLLAVVVAAHIAFGVARLPFGAIRKRAADVAAFTAAGSAGYHFRLADDETRRIAAWLCATVRADQLVLYEGAPEGSMQLLAPLLFPALCVRASAARTGSLADRPVFAARAPWLGDTGGQPIVVATAEHLRLVYR